LTFSDATRNVLEQVAGGTECVGRTLDPRAGGKVPRNLIEATELLQAAECRRQIRHGLV
jgi:hypothetical protein